MNRNGKEPEFMTVEQAAKMLGIGRTLAYESAQRGELPTIRMGKRVLIPRRALELWIQQCAERASARQPDPIT